MSAKSIASTTKPKATESKAKATKPTAKATKPTAARPKAKTAKPQAIKPNAKATRPKAKAGTTKAKATRTVSARAKAAAAAPSGREPLDVVKPLIRVRQMREFTAKRVTNAEIEAITEVARWSGSSRNEQPCRFVVLRDRDVIRRIAELGLPQTRGLPTANAAIAIVVPEEPERELSRAFDDGRAAERMLIAANLLRLGGGISRVRRDVREGIDEALGLPANRSVRTIVAIGHPTEDALAPKSRPGRARLPREQVIFEERWPRSRTSS